MIPLSFTDSVFGEIIKRSKGSLLSLSSTQLDGVFVHGDIIKFTFLILLLDLFSMVSFLLRVWASIPGRHHAGRATPANCR